MGESRYLVYRISGKFLFDAYFTGGIREECVLDRNEMYIIYYSIIPTISLYVSRHIFFQKPPVLLYVFFSSSIFEDISAVKLSSALLFFNSFTEQRTETSDNMECTGKTASLRLCTKRVISTIGDESRVLKTMGVFFILLRQSQSHIFSLISVV